MDHDFETKDLVSVCRVCGARVTIMAVMTNQVRPCPGVAVPGTNMRYYGMQKVFPPRKNVIIDDLTSTCECGAHKLGHKFGSPFHSSWCPWSKK